MQIAIEPGVELPMQITVDLEDGIVAVRWPTNEVARTGTPETEFRGELTAEEAFELCAALFNAAIAVLRGRH